MTTDREILPEHRNELKHPIKVLFIWSQGASAITELMRTVRDNDPNKMEIIKLYSLFRLHFIPERNKFHSRADLYFFVFRFPNETKIVSFHGSLNSNEEAKLNHTQTFSHVRRR